MSKSVDINGFWEIKGNPLTKEGVFMYLGRQIDPEGDKWGLDADRIYWVYRPKDEIAKDETLHSFEGVPFIDEHTMLGEGCTPTDHSNIAGVIHNIRMKGNVMIGDFKIYSDEIKQLISKGKKQLSIGYRATFVKKTGVFNGKAYDFVQVGLVGNHVALVDNGRCGSDVRIFDKAVVCDSLEIPQMEINKEELKSILDGMDEETLAKAKAALDGLVAPTPVSDTADDKTDDEKKEDEKKEVKDGCADENKDESEKDEVKDGDDKGDENKDDEKKDDEKKEVKDEAVVLDEAAIRKDAAKKLRDAIELHDKLVPFTGEFCMDEMLTVEDVAVYGCKKLELDVNAGSEVATLTGFLAGRKAEAGKVITTDSAVKTETKFDFKAAYLAK